ncbi:STAS domain-containing protein [Saccharothrix xinjiangensis]|uniref:STAS domain-containing protein n=1 Tax=Saccharothrix xinjiangensis TaxID=204798 RepID=A0ABV9XZ88_9PSEU
MLDGGAPGLVLDLSGVTSCDSSSLATAIVLWQHAAEIGTGFVLVAVPDRLVRLMRVAGVQSLIPVCPATWSAGS